jgi:hypothetical protein
MRMMRLWQADLDKEKEAFEKERMQWEEDCAAFEVSPAIPTGPPLPPFGRWYCRIVDD